MHAQGCTNRQMATRVGLSVTTVGEIVRKHRHAKGRIYALTQRPAESDKTIVGNAAVIHTGFMAFAEDRAYMARCLDIPVQDVAKLGRLDWIERNMRTRDLARGRLKFR
jgi:hypothetical protein